jgi:hypothetical protein
MRGLGRGRRRQQSRRPRWRGGLRLARHGKRHEVRRRPTAGELPVKPGHPTACVTCVPVHRDRGPAQPQMTHQLPPYPQHLVHVELVSTSTAFAVGRTGTIRQLVHGDRHVHDVATPVRHRDARPMLRMAGSSGTHCRPSLPIPAPRKFADERLYPSVQEPHTAHPPSRSPARTAPRPAPSAFMARSRTASTRAAPSVPASSASTSGRRGVPSARRAAPPRQLDRALDVARRRTLRPQQRDEQRRQVRVVPPDALRTGACRVSLQATSRWSRAASAVVGSRPMSSHP